MKKRILFVVILFAFIANAKVYSESKSYVDSEGGFSFSIPSGWVEISKSAIEERVNQIERDTSKKLSATPVTILKLDEAENFVPPYINITVYRHYGRFTKELFEKKYVADSEKKMLKGAAGEYVRRGIVSNLSSSGKVYDEDNNLAIYRGQMEIEGIGKTDGINAAILGREVLVIIGYMSTLEEYDNFVYAFERILETFRFEVGFEYDENQRKKSHTLDRTDNMPWYIRDSIKVIAWLPILIVFYGVYYFKNKYSKNSKDE